MRILLKVTFPHEPFNAHVRDGSAGKRIQKILDELKPEAVYFTELHGHRCGLIFLDLPEPSRIPSLCEPWFLGFGADVELRPAMKPEDLMKAGLEELGKKWGK
jgi:hypothetical protein